MFYGAIPGAVQAIVSEIAGKWKCADVFVGCSGNFTVERVLCGLGKFRLHGNDINTYSAAIGNYFAGTPLTFKVKSEYEERFGWLNEYLVDPVQAVASIMLAMWLVKSIGANGVVKRNAYWDRMLRGYRNQWKAMVTTTAAKLENHPLRLTSFYTGDVMDLLEKMPADAGFVSYPPFFGRETAYSKDEYGKLMQLFEWESPTFTPLDPQRMSDFFQMATNRKHWIVGSNEILPDLEPYLRGRTKTTSRAFTINVYASDGATRIVMPMQRTLPVKIPRIIPGMVIGNRAGLVQLEQQQFYMLRSQYMNHNIRPGRPNLQFGVTVDGSTLR